MGRLSLLVFAALGMSLVGGCVELGLDNAYVYDGDEVVGDYSVVMILRDGDPDWPAETSALWPDNVVVDETSRVSPYDALCTGTVLGQRLILTAGHCVRYGSDQPDGEIAAPSQVHIALGNHIMSRRMYLEESDHVSPVEHILTPYGKDGCLDASCDIAFLVLRAPRAGEEYFLPAKPVASTPVEPGNYIELVGFGNKNGNTEQPSAGVKRRGLATVSDVNGAWFESSLIGCKGDSGGAAIRNGEVLGVLAWVWTRELDDGNKDMCHWKNAWTPIANFSDLLAEARALAGSEATPIDDRCAPVDAHEGSESLGEITLDETDDLNLSAKTISATVHSADDEDVYKVTISDAPFARLDPFAKLSS